MSANTAPTVRTTRRNLGGLSVDAGLADFVEQELLPKIRLDQGSFWRGLGDLVARCTARNQALLNKRQQLQQQVQQWFSENGQASNDQHLQFLKDIGYCVSPPGDVRIETRNVDPEIAAVAGPQLVVPVSNARFAINAANARWGSLFDALYGTDVIPKKPEQNISGGYCPVRGAAVIRYATRFLDHVIPLQAGRHQDVVRWVIQHVNQTHRLFAELENGTLTTLEQKDAYRGMQQSGGKRSLLFVHHGLHIELKLDPEHPVGKSAPGKLADVELESAITTIQDCEDSVAAVDAEDKVQVYRNWLGLMQGDLSVQFHKSGKTMQRRLAPDRQYTAADGSCFTLPGRSLMLVRNVGLLMHNEAVLDADSQPIFEGLLDAYFTVACAMVAQPALTNSRKNSIYVVKPKLHGPEEARFTSEVFDQVEQSLGLPRYTVKIGVMDEERRTSVNLLSCMDAVRHRLVFINTGFLDRTGDEIHTTSNAGPVAPKAQIKDQPWIQAYEDRNVEAGLQAGLPGKGQIGKGMWPKPDEMRAMLDQQTGAPSGGGQLCLGTVTHCCHLACHALSRGRCRPGTTEHSDAAAHHTADDVDRPPGTRPQRPE